MTFNELFEKEDDPLEYLLKSSENWCREMYKDYNTNTFKGAVRCYIDDEILSILEDEVSLKETFYVKGIGLLRFNQTNHYDPKYYVELVERED
jgi:Zn/Cd-binding protein ZinT